jgi:hypothetical protein
MEGIEAVPGLPPQESHEDAVKRAEDIVSSLMREGHSLESAIETAYRMEDNSTWVLALDQVMHDFMKNSNRVYEKSSSEKQARFMAAAAHDPKFAKKAGIDQSVAKEFNKADTGTKQLSRAMKNVSEDESDMQTASTAAVNDAEANFDASQAGATEVDETKRTPHVASCKQSNPAAARKACAMESIDFSDASSWDMSDLVSAFRAGQISNAEYEKLLAQAIAGDDGYTDWSMRQGEMGNYSPGLSEGAGPTVHTFPDSRDAYDATQTGQWYDDETDDSVEVKDGDILLIPTEGVVGLCTTWPVAVTKNSGQLHAMKAEYATPEDIAEVTKLPLEAVKSAFQKAQELGFETVGNSRSLGEAGVSDDELSKYRSRLQSIQKKFLDASGNRRQDSDNARREYARAYEKLINDMPDAHREHVRMQNQELWKNDKSVTDRLSHRSPVDEAYDINNGYKDVKVADGQDYFPNGADGPVVKKVGPSGAKQGDNPEQKKMQIEETHKELVYAYRKYLSENKVK